MMSRFQKNLYQDLMNLVEEDGCFYHKDFELDGCIYRVFNYRLFSSYTDFLKPSALDCRGAMFEITEDGKPLRLASLPIPKFFNLNENPMTMDLDFSEIEQIHVKADGSLMSTYLHWDGGQVQLRLKSKGSIFSDHCNAAMDFLNHESNWDFFWQLRQLALIGYTVSMEWCSPEPEYRIVVGYEKPDLKVLAIRNNDTGEEVGTDHPDIDGFLEIEDHMVPGITTPDDTLFVSRVPEMEDVEGFVLRFPSWKRVKIKTNWYLVRHHTKDSVNNPRRLFEAVVEEATDDMRSLFHGDPIAIQLIEEMEEKVAGIYRHYVDLVERFHGANSALERKEYALLGQRELPRMAFSLAMNKYIGRETNYREWMKKHWRDFGIKDETEEISK
jgi:T4 RnlA family RNA ligase